MTDSKKIAKLYRAGFAVNDIADIVGKSKEAVRYWVRRTVPSAERRPRGRPKNGSPKNGSPKNGSPKNGSFARNRDATVPYGPANGRIYSYLISNKKENKKEKYEDYPKGTQLAGENGSDVMDLKEQELSDVLDAMDGLLDEFSDSQFSQHVLPVEVLGVLHPDPPVAFVKSPPAPRLVGNNRADIRWMERAYRCVYRYRTGKVAKVPRDFRHRIKHVLPTMREHDVRPHAWAMFRFLAAEKMNEAKGAPQTPPTITGVFACAAFENPKTMAWFYERENEIIDARGFQNEPLNQLYLVLQHARQELHAKRVSTRLEAERVYYGIISTEKYARAVERAEKERARLEIELTRRLVANEWLWGHHG